MKIEGSSDIPAPRERVWKAFLDPVTLARAIPGCEGLEEIGPGEYKAKMKVGVAAIKGTFEGKVRLFDLEPPNRYKMALEGSGGPRLRSRRGEHGALRYRGGNAREL
jgi:carbon monoxide dehydrogenase subunit G